MKALQIESLEKTYPNGTQALKGISFHVDQGDFFALLGPNGAGKSTAIGIMTSLVNKTGGRVVIDGHDIDTDFPAAKRSLGVVPQEFNFNVFEHPEEILVTQAGYYGVDRKTAEKRAQYYLEKCELTDKRHTQVRQLSGGMKRRLMIARALVHEPKLLILDEPTAGVDIEIRRSMWTFLRELNQQGTTIILTTHYLEEAENLCKHIAIINQGMIVENCSMPTLLKKLARETFVLTCLNTLTEAPTLAGFSCYLQEDQTLAVEIKQGQTVNDLFDELNRQHIKVTSLRNKTNRLEEIFVNTIARNS